MIFCIIILGTTLFDIIFGCSVWFPKGEGFGFPKGKGLVSQRAGSPVRGTEVTTYVFGFCLILFVFM